MPAGLSLERSCRLPSVHSDLLRTLNLDMHKTSTPTSKPFTSIISKWDTI